MTTNLVKELLSIHYIEIIASRQKFHIFYSKTDDGVDMSIQPQKESHDVSGKFHGLPHGRFLQIQMKSTTTKNIIETDDFIKYDFRAKNFNDLVERKDDITPLILILFIFPESETEWVQITQNEMTLRKCAYWYQVDKNAEMTKNKKTVTVKIPKTNFVDLDFFHNFFKSYNS